MVLLLALGAMGTAYGAWVDDIYIEGTLSTSSVDASLACGSCWEEVDGEVTDVPDTDIDCSGGSMTLTVDVENAMEDVDYYCSFDVINNSTSLPIKIHGMMIGGPEPGVEVLIEDIAMGDVIDPLGSATGKIHVYLVTDNYAGEDIAYEITIYVGRWNE